MSITINTYGINLDTKLTKAEKNKKVSIEAFLRRLDLFIGCLKSNLETSKRKFGECEQRFHNETNKIMVFFDQISKIFTDFFSK